MMQNKKGGIRIIFVAILAVILMLIACSKVRQTSPLQKFTYNSGKVNSEVLASLKSNGIVPVIITTTDFDSRVEVISILTKDEFNIKRGFDSVPAFAGDVLKESALQKLEQNDKVIRVQIDSPEYPT